VKKGKKKRVDSEQRGVYNSRLEVLLSQSRKCTESRECILDPLDSFKGKSKGKLISYTRIP
jgi:hypothetical protein